MVSRAVQHAIAGKLLALHKRLRRIGRATGDETRRKPQKGKKEKDVTHAQRLSSNEDVRKIGERSLGPAVAI